MFTDFFEARGNKGLVNGRGKDLNGQEEQDHTDGKGQHRDLDPIDN